MTLNRAWLFLVNKISPWIKPQNPVKSALYRTIEWKWSCFLSVPVSLIHETFLSNCISLVLSVFWRLDWNWSRILYQICVLFAFLKVHFDLAKSVLLWSFRLVSKFYCVQNFEKHCNGGISSNYFLITFLKIFSSYAWIWTDF